MAYITTDNTIWRTPRVFDDNSEGDSVNILPTVSFFKDGADFELENEFPEWYSTPLPSRYEWKILQTKSNFKNAFLRKTFVEYEAYGMDTSSPRIKISKLQEGEVYFILLECFAIMEDGDVLKWKSIQTAIKGEPINTSFEIITEEMGSPRKTRVFDSPIEKHLLDACLGKMSAFPEAANFGGRIPFNHKENVGYFLSTLKRRIHNKTDFTSISENQDENVFQKYYDKNTKKASKALQRRIRKTRVSVQFNTIEAQMYAHGRAIDLESIYTLAESNPLSRNDSQSPPLKPDPKHLIEALHNRLIQPIGYNSFVVPLTMERLSPTSNEVVIDYPGRSSFTIVVDKTRKRCGDLTGKYWVPVDPGDYKKNDPCGDHPTQTPVPSTCTTPDQECCKAIDFTDTFCGWQRNAICPSPSQGCPFGPTPVPPNPTPTPSPSPSPSPSPTPTPPGPTPTPTPVPTPCTPPDSDCTRTPGSHPSTDYCYNNCDPYLSGFSFGFQGNVTPIYETKLKKRTCTSASYSCVQNSMSPVQWSMLLAQVNSLTPFPSLIDANDSCCSQYSEEYGDVIVGYSCSGSGSCT